MATLLLLAALLQSPAAIGQVVAQFALTDIHYLKRSLDDLGAHDAYVLLFVTRSCPLAQRYLPRVIEMERDYRGRDVQFALINAGAGDSILEVAQQMVESGIAFPVLKDFDGDGARALGVTHTPEVAVLDRRHVLRYRGRIDAQYRLTGVNPQPGRADLRAALEDVLAGRDVAVPTTPVDGCLITLAADAPAAASVTYAEHVAPILYLHCVECHRPGGQAPFSLCAYDEVASQAQMIAEVVREQRMPPWYAAPGQGEFLNHRGTSAEERRLIRAWVAAKTPPGDLSKAPPPPPPRTSPWLIGEPDLVIKQLTMTTLPADGYVPYQYVVLPYVFLHDTWVSAAQILPENTRALHHANLGYFKLGEKFKTENFITGLVPGGDPMQLDEGVAVLIPAGSVLGLQAHYVTTGTPGQDRLSVGLRFPHVPVQKRLYHYQIHDARFRIPPGAPAHEVHAAQTFAHDATGVGMFSHMHVRGRDMTFRATYPDGSSEVLLMVPNYNFDWQSSYRWAPASKHFPAGTRVDVVAHFDNSPFNPYNPDPGAQVRFGLQTDQEMMYGFLFYTQDDECLDLHVDPKSGQAGT
ncbi:MAG: redoxin domain-containing protein [Planctomycetota bacterium]